MRNFLLVAVMLVITSAFASEKFSFSFKDKEIGDIIHRYSELTGEKFIYDRAVSGKTTLVFPEKITKEEAYNALSEALKIQGYGIVKINDHLEVRTAQNLVKDGVEVFTDVPAVQPARVVTYIHTLKNADSDYLLKVVRPYINNFWRDHSSEWQKRIDYH